MTRFVHHAVCATCVCRFCPKCLDTGVKVPLKIVTKQFPKGEPQTQAECPVCGWAAATYTSAEER